MNLAALLFDVARRLPQQPAVSDGDHAWNYRELARRIAGIAGGLRAYGLRPGDRVLLSLENCGEFFELLFGCWAAGLCAVPANARLHPREVEYIVENSGARLLVATPALAEALMPLAGSVDGLDRVISTGTAEYAALVTNSEPLVPAAGDPTDRAWLFYTSGTTGRPKGAVLTHRNLLFMSQCYYADIDAIDERDTHLAAAPLSHGAGLYALPFVLKGAHQLILPHFDVAAILEALRQYERVSMFAAPTMLTRLAHAPEMPDADLANLKTIYYGGGPMYAADLEKALGLFGPRLYQLFGQGESPMTITGLSQRLHADSGHPRWRERLGSCGVARTGVLVRVVDEHDEELPPGEVGEVITKSDCVMEGYWENPAAKRRDVARRLAAYRRSRQHRPGRLPDPARPLEGHDHLGRQQHLSARDRGGVAAPPRCRRGFGGRPAAPRLGRGGRRLRGDEAGSDGSRSGARPLVPRPYRPLQAATRIPLCRGPAEEQLRQGAEDRPPPATRKIKHLLKLLS
jgi:acyl-CoA synthetase (AMP-forming)/AMP-acid ligase II